MLIYLEKRAKEFPTTKKILDIFKNAQVLEIDHYKNIFDKNIWDGELTPAFIIAIHEHPKLLDVPDNYGYPGKAYFFKTSLNCIFNCEYCYLKGNFKTKYPVIFVNYDDIKNSIADKINEIRNDGNTEQITLYSSNYSDIQGLDKYTGFNESFIPFIEQFDNVLMETRTKSGDIDSILKCNNGIVPKNTEIAFSLNPFEVILKFEKGTAPLEKRIEAITTLLNKGYKVGLRFLPLLPIDNYQIIYSQFLDELKKKIDIPKLHSIFIASLIYNQGDFKEMQKKNPDSELWNYIKLSDNGLIKLPDNIFHDFVQIFENSFPNTKIFYDYI